MSNINNYAEVLFIREAQDCNVLGLTLEPLCFSHFFFLQLVGSAYAYEGVTKVNEVDLLSAVFICHHTPEELWEFYETKADVSKTMLVWQQDFVKQKQKTLSIEDQLRIFNSKGDYGTIMGTLITRQDHEYFHQYLTYNNSTPPFRLLPDKIDSKHPRSFQGDLDNLFTFVQHQHPDWDDQRLLAYSIKRARLDRLNFYNKEGIGVFINPDVADQPAGKIIIKK